MTERILRLTRHEAKGRQLSELGRIFGDDCEIIMVPERVSGADRVAELVKEHQATVLEAVLPLPILAEVINPRTGVGVPVIRAFMQGELTIDGAATFCFSHYERVLKVEVQVERL